MSRRDESKRKKIQAEEDDLDQKLKDAGLYEAGMGLDEKRAMLQCLEDSCATADKEAEERNTWRRREEELLKDTLNRSFKDVEGGQHGAVDSSIARDCDDTSNDSDIIALPSGSKVAPAASGNSPNGSVSPEISCVRPRWRPTSQRSSEPVASGSQSSKASNDDSEDILCDSQTSSGGFSTNSVSCPSKRPQLHGKRTITEMDTSKRLKVSDEPQPSTSQGLRKVPRVYSRKRQNSVEEVETSQKVICTERGPSPSMFPNSSGSNRRLSDDDGIQLLSPIIGKKKNVPHSYSQSVQDAQVSNSIEVRPLKKSNVVTTVEDSDDDIFPSPSVCASTTGSDSRNSQDNQVLSSTPSLPPKSQNQVTQGPSQGGKESEEEEEEVQETVDKGESQPSPQHGSISESEEGESFNFQNDKQRNINVFSTSHEDDIPLVDKRKCIRERKELAFFKMSEESVPEGVSRILGHIADHWARLEQYQATLPRLKWSTPVTMDRRVKDSLDRPVRKKGAATPHAAREAGPSTRAAGLRSSAKTSHLNDGSRSESDELPDPNSEDDFIFSRGRNNRKKIEPKAKADRTNSGYSSLEEQELKEASSKVNNIFKKATFNFRKNNDLKNSLEKPCDEEENSSSSQVSSSEFCNKRDKDKSKSKENADGYDDLAKQLLSLTSPNRSGGTKEPCETPSTNATSLEYRKALALRSLNGADSPMPAFDKPSDSSTPDPKQTPASLDEPSTSGIKVDPKTQNHQPTPRNLKRKRVKPLNFVSSSKSGECVNSNEDSMEVEPGTSGASDVCVLDRLNTPAASTQRSTKVPLPSVDKSKDQVVIRPAPLKLKKKTKVIKPGAGERGSPELEVGGEVSAGHISSSVGAKQDEKSDGQEEVFPCPMCNRSFPRNEIERHASDCMGESSEEPVLPSTSHTGGSNGGRREKGRISPSSSSPALDAVIEDGSDVEVEEVNVRGRGRQRPALAGSSRPRTPPDQIRCVWCKVLTQRGDEYLLHVNECPVMRQMEETTRNLPHMPAGSGRGSGFRRADGPGPYASTARPSPGSVFDQLERTGTPSSAGRSQASVEESSSSGSSDDSEVYEFPSSPPRTFVPISQQKDCAFDYHNQFNSRTRKPIRPGAVGKRRRKTSKKRKSWKKAKRA